MIQDIKQAFRQIAAHPGFTLVTVLTLGLGIGANTAIFSVARGVLLRPLPYAHGGALVHIMPRAAGTAGDDLYFPVPEVFDYRRQTQTLSSVMEYHSMAFTLLGHGDPDRVQTGVVSSNFFHEFGVRPVLGRDFRPEDEQPGADPVLLLTYDYWRDRFGADPSIIGQRLRMNDKPILVVGVLPSLPSYPGKDQIFMPTESCPYRSKTSTKASRTFRLVSLWGRLKPGVTLEKAQADLSTIAARDQKEYPAAAIAGMSLSLVPVREELVGHFRPTLVILFGTVGLVLLLACANAANLTFARLLSREKEVVVRAALGASRGRLIRQLLTESVLTSLIGGAVGCLMAISGLGLLIAFTSRFTPRATEVHIDAPVLLFSLVLSVLVGLASGWVPTVQALRHNLAAALKEGTGRSTASVGKRRFRDLMVAAQVGVSFVLLIGAALMVRSLVRLVQVDPGLRADQVLTATLELPQSKYAPGPPVVAFYQRLLQDLESQADVVSATVSSDVPMGDAEFLTPAYQVEGQIVPPGRPAPRADLHIASEDYFKTLGIPMREGHAFTSQDAGVSSPVVIVNQELARQWWPNRSALGRRINIDLPRGPQWRTVIGVVADAHYRLTDAPRPSLYVPFAQLPGNASQLFIRTRTDPNAFIADLRSTVAEIDRDQPVANVQTLEQVRGSAMSPTRLTTILLSLFAALALAITGIGIGAAVSFAVAERLQEMAIRMALGADGGSVLSLLFKRAMGPVLLGLAFGFGAEILLTRLLAALLFGVKTSDPLALAGALLTLLAIGAVTCLLPARRATKVDPARV
ncbi:MAG TPA: ABC transporter permease, partial [Thermoanaerobaculia bacterium]|nr:ABC transporter permease [Thermoanaerobaculia bacterium]